ncbi:glycogen debranching protein GlgX [Marinomonas sp. THO17]|uniref:glycogen debranching protein GlgX n=1 Tax=Marinomonas sp. THO17 TaxID=3149048 RepID=UPI00336C1C17
MGRYQVSQGQAFPLGASVTQQGVNFAVVSEDATQLHLCLFDDNEQLIESLPFVAKHRGIWHMQVLGLEAGQKYGLRAEGPFDPAKQLLFNPAKLLIDPYAKALTGKLVWHPEQASLDEQLQLDKRDSAHCVPKCIVLPSSIEDSRPPRNSINPQQRVIYELHVKGFTQQLPIEEALKGTYLGVISATAITHLQSLNITTIQLMPCFTFATERHLHKLGLNNYWGYNPVNFFTPEPSYAQEDAIREFRSMIDGLREAGFEVILDVVYNHTAESEIDQSCVSFRGLDNARYYRHQHGEYLNYTGCGNCINTHSPASIRLICDSMRYWVNEMGVDGFRFDLGVDLGRVEHDFSANAPLLQAILQDPVLSQTCLVMEPWDIGPNGYQVGQFPKGFLECNDKYRDTIRRFWRGDQGMIAEFATRIMGSRDCFHKGLKSALNSVNYITYHDGFTLRDLVSYEQRHNLANMEDNRDGHGDNISVNFGVEGPSDDPIVEQQRFNQQICLLASLLLSQGTPHLLGGDELSHSQQGNNNAYCQDNEITWLNWQANKVSQSLQTNLAKLIKLRQTYPILTEVHLADDPLFQHLGTDQVAWLNQQSEEMTEQDWHDANNHYLAMMLTTANLSCRLWLVFYNQATVIRVPVPVSQGQQVPAEALFLSPNAQLKEQQLCLNGASVALIKL